jgi:hypothetical protein
VSWILAIAKNQDTQTFFVFDEAPEIPSYPACYAKNPKQKMSECLGFLSVLDFSLAFGLKAASSSFPLALLLPQCDKFRGLGQSPSYYIKSARELGGRPKSFECLGF